MYTQWNRSFFKHSSNFYPVVHSMALVKDLSIKIRIKSIENKQKKVFWIAKNNVSLHELIHLIQTPTRTHFFEHWCNTIASFNFHTKKSIQEYWFLLIYKTNSIQKLFDINWQNPLFLRSPWMKSADEMLHNHHELLLCIQPIRHKMWDMFFLEKLKVKPMRLVLEVGVRNGCDCLIRVQHL